MGERQKENSGQTVSVELGLLLRQGTAFLSQAGVEASGYDAGVLLEQITGRQRLLLYGGREPLSTGTAGEFLEASPAAGGRRAPYNISWGNGTFTDALLRWAMAC